MADPRLFCAVVFVQIAPGPGFSQSVTQTLPGAFEEAQAWQQLFNALQADPALIGGTLKEVSDHG